MDDSVPNTSPISSSVLKWIAIFTMMIDHIGAVLIEPLLYNPSSSVVGGTVNWQTIYTSSRLIRRIIL